MVAEQILHVTQFGETQCNQPHHKKEIQDRTRLVHVRNRAYVNTLKPSPTARRDQSED